MCSPDFQEDLGGELTYLRLHKPTENRGWVHILCAVFCSEIQFTDASRLRVVEGLSSVPESKRTAVCKALPLPGTKLTPFSQICALCQRQGGVTLKCTDTPESVHVSCAYLAGFAVGFDLQTVSSHPVNA